MNKNPELLSFFITSIGKRKHLLIKVQNMYTFKAKAAGFFASVKLLLWTVKKKKKQACDFSNVLLISCFRASYWQATWFSLMHNSPKSWFPTKTICFMLGKNPNPLYAYVWIKIYNYQAILWKQKKKKISKHHINTTTQKHQILRGNPSSIEGKTTGQFRTISTMK